MYRRIAVFAIVVALVASACSGRHKQSVPTTTNPNSVVTDPAGTVWLCHPGQLGDPCATALTKTVVPGSGARTVESPTLATNSPFDCFYVYPTASDESTDNADLTIQATEVAVTVAQAAPFSQVCRVWAPMYRQRTNQSLQTHGLGGDQQGDLIAYNSVLSAWTDYVQNYNDGRPVIFIGHSQGAAMLIRLLEQKVDPDPAMRDKTVVAIILGGNVTVATGQLAGATFKNLPLCTSQNETGCVIAYSSFPSQPSANADFGRPGQGVSLQTDQTQTHGVQVACVNPANIGGSTAALTPIFLTQSSPAPAPPVTTPWVTYPHLYTASCASGEGANWLQVTSTRAAGDLRSTVSAPLGPSWGFHEDDVNLALGNLVQDVAAEESAYTSAHPGS